MGFLYKHLKIKNQPIKLLSFSIREIHLGWFTLAGGIENFKQMYVSYKCIAELQTEIQTEIETFKMYLVLEGRTHSR